MVTSVDSYLTKRLTAGISAPTGKRTGR